MMAAASIATRRQPFDDRAEAARELAARLRRFVDLEPVIIGLPRSGMPVAAMIADDLGAPLEVVVVRKLGVPARHPHALGAVCEGGVRILLHDVLDETRVTAETITGIERRERAELARQASCYRAGQASLDLHDRVCVIVDDAIVSGGSMRAALRFVRSHGARQIVLAAPVGGNAAIEQLRREADDVVVVASPTHLRSVGRWYRDLPDVTDDEIVALLNRARRARG